MRKRRKILALVATAILPIFLGCGRGGGGGGSSTGEAPLDTEVAALTTTSPVATASRPECLLAQPMPRAMDLTWNETEQCVDLAAPPPTVVYSQTVICPRSGQADCLATVPFFPCSDDPSRTCGAIGRFLPECGAIELPDRYQGAAAHEMIHYLLKVNGYKQWAEHSGPQWACQ
jgi:hypothetical protein